MDPPPPTPFKVRRVLGTEADLPLLRQCAAVESLAFSGTDLSRIVFPGPFSPDSHDKRARELLANLREGPGTHIFVAVNPDADEKADEAVLGWAKWVVYPDATPPPKPRVWGPGTNQEAANLVFGAMDKMRERVVVGKPCVCKSVPVFAVPYCLRTQFHLFCSVRIRSRRSPRSSNLGHRPETPAPWHRPAAHVVGDARGCPPQNPLLSGIVQCREEALPEMRLP